MQVYASLNQLASTKKVLASQRIHLLASLLRAHAYGVRVAFLFYLIILPFLHFTSSACKM